MGTWGTSISSNDTYDDIYGEFFDLYNDGLEVSDITKKLIANNQEIINNNDDSNNFWFALAKAQWECKQLEKGILERVKNIIETGGDLEVWRQLEANEKDIKKRKIVLDKFLSDLLTERPKAKTRKKKVIRQPVYEIGTCLTFKLDSGNYGGAVVLSSDKQTGIGFNLVALTRINQVEKPKLHDFQNSEILFMNNRQVLGGHFLGWYPAKGFKKNYSELFETVDYLKINKQYDIEGNDNNNLSLSYCFDWYEIIHSSNIQFKYEESNQKGNKTIRICDLT